MPRSARFVAPGVAHHITQRGTDRQLVFHCRADRLTYLRLLRQQAALGGLPILAYCLMSNHIHLIAAPLEAESLAAVMQRVHGRYAQYLNARRGRCGHLWQNRFSSCALGPSHLWAALRYVEMNPVRARSQYNGVNASLGDSNFGKVTSAFDPRIMEFGGKIVF